MPRVLYIGNFAPEHSTENDVRRAFEHLGWEVDRCEERDFTAAANGHWSNGTVETIPDRCLNADLVLHTMTQGSYPRPERVLALWALCEEKGVPTASIHLDLFYGLSSPKDSGPQRCDLPRLHPMFRVDHVFTADGGHQAEFARDGVNHHWLPPAVRYDEARRIEPTDADRAKWGDADVAFVGSTGYHREYPERNELVARLRAHYGARFVHIGNGGDRCNNHDEPNLRGEALNRMYATVPVVVGDYCFANRQPSLYWSDRFPEVWGRGGYLVFPRTDALAEQIGGAYPSWEIGDWDGLFTTVDAALTDPEGRRMLRETLQPVIAAEHTYVNRVQTMLNVIGLGITAPVLLDVYRAEVRAELLEMADRAETLARDMRARAEALA